MKIINFNSNAKLTPQELLKKLIRSQAWYTELEERSKQLKKNIHQLCILLTLQVPQKEKVMKRMLKQMRNEKNSIDNEIAKLSQFFQELEDYLLEKLQEERIVHRED